MRCLVVLAVMVQVAHADPAADANKAFQAFVGAVAAKKPLTDVDVFIPPTSVEHGDKVGDLGELAGLIDKTKLKILATHLATSGTAAWVLAQLPAKLTINIDKGAKVETVRASAFLTLDAGVWHVRATHWSAGKPDEKAVEGCGNIDEAFAASPNIPKDAAPLVKLVTSAFAGQLDGKGTSAHVLPVLSSDKSAQMWGSAPNETFTGAAAIAKVYKKWKIDLYTNDEHVRAGIAPGGDMAWLATEVQSDWMCTSYRALFVLQKEGSAWKIVHQHFSEWVLAP